MHIQWSTIAVIFVTSLVVLAVARRRDRCSQSPAFPRTQAAQRSGGCVTPILLVMVVALLAFGLLGSLANRPHRSRVYVAEAAGAAQEVREAGHEFQADLKEWVEEFKAGIRDEILKKKSSAARRPRKPAAAPKPAPSPATPDPAPEAEAEWTRRVSSFGETRDDALHAAVQKCMPELLSHLRHREPSFDAVPSPAFVLKHFVAKTSFEEGDFGDSEGVLHVQANIEVAVTPRALDALARYERHCYAEQRLAWLARLMSVVVLVLASVAAYVRVDEWSQGYYTGWLRLAAAGFLVASGLGLWFLAGH